MAEWNMIYASDPLCQNVQQQLCIQQQGLQLAKNKLAAVEQQIQDLMQQREDIMYEIEDRSAEVEETQQKVFECRSKIKDRWDDVRKRYHLSESTFCLFRVLPPELYVYIFKFLTPVDICRANVNRAFASICNTDMIWSRLFLRAFGKVDDLCCSICNHLTSPSLPFKPTNSQQQQQQTYKRSPLQLIVKPKSNSNSDDDDMTMTDVQITDASPICLNDSHATWLTAFKHRKQIEKNWNSGKCTANILTGHTDWVTCTVFNGPRLISGSWDSSIKVWDLNTKQCVVTLTGHTAGINSLGLSDNGKVLLSASLDGTLRVWNTDQYTCSAVLEGHKDQLSHVAFLDIPAPQQSHNRHSSPSSSPPTTSAASTTMSGSQNIAVTGSLDGTLRIWNLSLGKCIYLLQGHTQGITGMTVSHKYVVSGSADGAIMLWDAQIGQLVFPLLGHTDRITCLHLEVSKKRLVSASWDFTTRVWDLKTGNCLHVLQGHVFRVRCIDVKDDTLVTGSWDSDVKVWDLKTGKLKRTLSGHTNYIWSVQIQGNRVMSASWDRSVRIWDLHSGALLSTLDHASEVLYAQANSHKLVAASKEIKIWDFSGEMTSSSKEKQTQFPHHYNSTLSDLPQRGSNNNIGGCFGDTHRL